jgi:hypothetical protein
MRAGRPAWAEVLASWTFRPQLSIQAIQLTASSPAHGVISKPSLSPQHSPAAA